MAFDIAALLALKQQLGFYGAGGGQRPEGQQAGEALANVGAGLKTAGEGIGTGADIAKKLFEAQKLKNEITNLGSVLGTPNEELKNQIFQNRTASQVAPNIYPQPSESQESPSTVGPNIPQVPAFNPLDVPKTPGLDFLKAHPQLNPSLTIGQNKDVLDALAKEKESARTLRPAGPQDIILAGKDANGNNLLKLGDLTNDEHVRLLSTQQNTRVSAAAAAGRQANQLAMTQQQIDIARQNLQREKGNDATRAFDTLTSAIRTKMEDPNITADQSKFLNDQLQFAATNGYLPQTSISGMRFLGMTLPSDFPFGKPVQKIVPKGNGSGNSLLQDLIDKNKGQ